MRLSSGIAASIWLGVAAGIAISQFHPNDIITRDVCVIGGGASGTYAAIRLQELGESVVLVEKEARLGGHTNTYIDPATGESIDYGVLAYQNIPEIINFFSHFNISTVVSTLSEIVSQGVDLRTGTAVAPIAGNETAAFMTYVEQISKYPYLADGWDLPDPVPADLLLPFGDFIEKYDIAPAVELITLWAQGVGNWLDYPTVYVFKYFSLALADAVENGFLFTTNHDNSALYQAAQAELGSNVFLNSTVVAMNRTDSSPHQIVLQTDSGLKLILANKTIITAPPLVDNLRNFDLDHTETNVFSQFSAAYYFATAVRIPGLPDGLQIVNRGADTEYNLAPMPSGIYSFTPSFVPELYAVYYGGTNETTEDEVNESIVDGVLKLQDIGLNTTEPDILAFASHSPFFLSVPAEAIANGFYKDLYALQGHRETYYAGAAFHAHDSSALWLFVENLLTQSIVV